MSANYSLDLVNPNAQTTPTSVVYTDGGNTLNLIIGNQFGFDMQIGGSSLGAYLVVGISNNILDDAGAKGLGVAAPWTINSYLPPGNSGGAVPQYYTFNLQPPGGGVTLPNGSSITITLRTLTPSAAGSGVVTVHYRFDNTSGDDLSALQNLGSLAPPDPKQPPLIGDNDALRLTPYVNGGSWSNNPIMVSAAPATSATAVDNQLQFNLLFQQATSAAPRATGQSGLIDGWSGQPPSIRVFFPYFGQGTLPAPLDLTDDLKAGDTNYNPITSAWNISGSLDSVDPDVTSDPFWQIALDPNAPVPVWLVTPTLANQYLFTDTESSSSEPGPVLNFYLMNVVSALPIDTRNPSTILYVQWNGFQGFNDGIVAYPLLKTTLAINRFDVTTRVTAEGPELLAQWETTGADHCLLTGDSDTLQASADFRKPITIDAPLAAAYTLTAVSRDGQTKVTRTRAARWRLNDGIAGVPVLQPYNLVAAPDARSLLLLGGPDSNHLGVLFFDAMTLQPRSSTPMLAAGNSVMDIAISPDAGVLYAMIYFTSAVYGYTLPTLQQTPGSGAAVPPNADLGYSIAVSADGSTVVQVSNPADQGPPQGQMVVLSAGTLQPVSGSPVALPDGAWAIAVGQVTGNYYLALPTELRILDASTFQTVGTPVALDVQPGLIAVSPDESSVYLLLTDSEPQSIVSWLVKIDVATSTVAARVKTRLGTFPILTFGSLAVSPDGSTLFFCGVDSQATNTSQHLVTSLAVLDTNTLEELPWSPISLGSLQPANLALSADGSRLFVTASPPVAVNNFVNATLLAVDPGFA